MAIFGKRKVKKDKTPVGSQKVKPEKSPSLVSRFLKSATGFMNTKTYRALDYGAFGRLPGGFTPKEVKTLDTGYKAFQQEQANVQNRRLREAQLQDSANKAQFEAEKDYLNKSFFENFGIGLNRGEEKVQSIQEQGGFYAASERSLRDTGAAQTSFTQAQQDTPNSEAILSSAATQASKTGGIPTMALIAGAALLAVVAWKK